MQIRVAGKADIERLRDIYNAARQNAAFPGGPVGQAAFARLLEQEEVFLAEQDDGIVGFIAVYVPESFIHHLYVEPAYQGRGFGRALLDFVAWRYPGPLSLKCLTHNDHALGFYRHLGWREDRECGVDGEGSWVRMLPGPDYAPRLGEQQA